MIRLAAALALLSVLGLTNAHPTDKGAHYAVIVDAGSSGSRIFVYKYEGSPTEMPKLELVKGKDGKPWSYKTKPGISTKAGKLGEVKAYVQDLIKHLKAEVPESSFPKAAWKKTPFMWFATAGMRLLKVADESLLTNKLREVMNDKAVVPFLFEDRWARTLSGEEEGAFAWISLNYLNGFFSKEGAEDSGVVETGGASAQMTFLAKGDILANKFVTVINHRVYPLYTHSFLYFGGNEVMKRVFHNECFCRTGDESCEPCMKNDYYMGLAVQSPCMIKGHLSKQTITHKGKDYQITVKGTGDAAKCAKEVDALFEADAKCFTKPCSFAGVYQPPFSTKQKFIGISAIRYAVEGVGLTKQEVTWPEVKNAADKFCEQPLAKLDKSDKYAATRCLTGMYTAKQFQHLRFAENHPIKIEKFGTWTVGAVLYQLELMSIQLPHDDDDDHDDDETKDAAKKPIKKPTKGPTKKPTQKPTTKPTSKPTEKPGLFHRIKNKLGSTFGSIFGRTILEELLKEDLAAKL